MEKDFYKGFSFAIIILGIIGALTAIGFHTADEILGGTFPGDYIFQNNVTFNGNVNGLSNDGVPSGAIIQFNDSNCPTGWSLESISSYELIPQALGTVIGDMTEGLSNSAAFNGVTSSVGASSAVKTGTATAYVGKDWGEGITKSISQVKAYAPTDDYFNHLGGTVTLTLQGSTDGFSSSIVNLGSTTISSHSYGEQTTFTIPDTTPYRYHRLYMSSSTDNKRYAEVEFYVEGTYICIKD